MSTDDRGSATAELVIALPLLLTLLLTGVKFLGETIEAERLRYLAEAIVQAQMRDESHVAITRELRKSLPNASFTISQGSAGEFTVTVRNGDTHARAVGYR